VKEITDYTDSRITQIQKRKERNGKKERSDSPGEDACARK